MEFEWPNGVKGAVSLTYDDALPCHYEYVGPLLEQFEFRGTFNISCGWPSVYRRAEEWSKLAQAGHELGNHAVHHPCRKDHPKDMSWVHDAFDLCHYTPGRWVAEMELANAFLKFIDGREERTFANTCCDNYLGTGDKKVCLETLVENIFLAARGECTGRAVNPETANFNALGCFAGDRLDAGQLKEIADEAVAKGQWAVFMFHGVGKDTHGHYVDKEEHLAFVEYLHASREDVWTAPMIEVARYLKDRKSR